MRNQKALLIQKRFRGMRGRLLAAIARALKILRAKQNFAALDMQRFVRGCIARDHVKQTRAKKIHEKIVLKAVMLIQRIFRGHKGRESGDVERKVLPYICICVYVYMCICTHMYTHMYAHMYTHVYTPTYTHKYTHKLSLIHI